MNYIVAAIGDWNKALFDECHASLNGYWEFVANPEELNAILDSGFEPRYIFFPHWRWIVPETILNRFECICFHMTDVPYGRGGSPLQNLIIRGHKQTVLTALQMEKGLDTGSVYFKQPLDLSGTAEQIYQRAGELTWQVIQRMVQENLQPTPQQGEVVVFKRRTPEQSELSNDLNLEQVYDFIRMLDAPSYPKAFIETESYRLEFEAADLQGDEIKAQVSIKLKD